MMLRPYQVIGRDFLAARRHALLADEMRVGKTPQAILAADRLGAERILVLCPAIATHQWAAEWARWSPRRRPAHILGGVNAIGPNGGIVVSSYTRAQMMRDDLTARRWDVVIADEAHMAKNPNALRTKLVYGKGGLGWNTRYLWALSGTPAPNHAGELWPMLRAFGLTRMDYEAFTNYFCYVDAEGRIFGNRTPLLPELRELIAPITLRRTRREVAPDMPEVGYSLLAVDPTPGVDLQSDDPGQVDREDRIAVAKAKVPMLATEIEEQLIAQTYTQTVVFGYHIEPLKLLRSRLENLGIEAELLTGATSDKGRQNVQAGFKMGAIEVVIAQIIAAGTAIDLSAASHGYMLEIDYVPGNNEQAASRLVNLQTQVPVTIDVLNWPGTADDRVQRTVLRKVQGAVFTA